MFDGIHLGDDLVMRSATVEDMETVAAFNAATVHPSHDGKPNLRIEERTRAFLGGVHPVVRAEDCSLVTEQGTGRVVSSMVMIRQVWQYAGVPVRVGQFEFVGTDPSFRGRGLIRRQFEWMHRKGGAQGQHIQAINGIPWFYRQFGYEYAVNMHGSRGALQQDVAQWLAQAPKDSGYSIRPADAGDIPFLLGLYTYPPDRSLLTVVRDEAMWRYELEGRREPNIFLRQHCIILSAAGERAGHFTYATHLPWMPYGIDHYELLPGHSWLKVTPIVIRYLQATPGVARKHPTFSFWLGADHPLYHIYVTGLRIVEPPAAWYIRIADVGGFMQKVRPAIERRLENSHFSDWSGNLTLNFYRSGLHLAFQQGKLVSVAPWLPENHREPGPSFPNLVFTQLLLGYRSLDELLVTYPDCSVPDDTSYALLNQIFPKRHSTIWEIS